MDENYDFLRFMKICFINRGENKIETKFSEDNDQMIKQKISLGLIFPNQKCSETITIEIVP